MRDYQQISFYINRVISDVRLKPIHISLSIALCHVWIRNNFQLTYTVSRKSLMLASHIQSIATYHKTLRDLQKFGHIEYHPSYHPVNASSVTLKLDRPELSGAN